LEEEHLEVWGRVDASLSQILAYCNCRYVIERAKYIVEILAKHIKWSMWEVNVCILEDEDSRSLFRVFRHYWRSEVEKGIKKAEARGATTIVSRLGRAGNANLICPQEQTKIKQLIRKDIALYRDVWKAHIRSLGSTEECDPQWWRIYRIRCGHRLRDWAVRGDGSVFRPNASPKSKKTKEKAAGPVRCTNLRPRLTLKQLSSAIPLPRLSEHYKEQFPTADCCVGNKVLVSEGEDVSLIGVDGNAFGDIVALGDLVTLDEVREWISTTEFASDSALGQACKGRFYRIEATEQSLFSLGSGRTVMASAPISDVGARLLIWATRLLSIQNNCVRQYIETHNLDVHFRPFDPNLMQIVVSTGGGLYSKHNDQGPEMSTNEYMDETSHKDLDGTELSLHLPYDYEQRVVTLVLLFPVEGMAGGLNERDGWCRLNHYRRDETTPVNTIVTKSCSVHIQGFGAQKYLLHDVAPYEQHGDGSCVKRVIISFRYTPPLEHHQRELYQAFSKSTGGSFDPAAILTPQNTYHFKSVLSRSPSKVGNNAAVNAKDKRRRKLDDFQAKEEICRLFMENFKRHESVDVIGRPGLVIVVPGTALSLLRGPEATRMLLKSGFYLAQPIFKDEVKKGRRGWLMNKYTLGGREPAANVRNRYGLLHCSDQVQVYQPKKEYPDVFVLEQAYKNKFTGEWGGGLGFREVLEKLEEDPAWLYKQAEGTVELWMGPRGGNAETIGTYNQPGVHSWLKDATHRTSCCQKNDTSREMDHNCRVRAVIHLFVPAAWLEGGTISAVKKMNQSPRDGDVVYMGVWYFYSKHEQQRPEWVWPENHNTCWLAEQSTIYHIRPLYHADSPPPPNVHIAEDLKQLREFEVVDGSRINHCIPRESESSPEEGDKEVSQGGRMLRLNQRDILLPWLDKMLAADEDGEEVMDDIDYGDSISDDRATSQELFSMDIDAYMEQAGRIASAAFARMIDAHVVGDSPQLMYLCGQRWRNLGWNSGTNCTPHPIRSYNLQTMTWLQACLSISVDESGWYYERLDTSNMTAQTITDYLVMASVVRLCGTVGWYGKFAEYVKEKEYPGIGTENRLLIPGTKELALFCKFLEETTPGGRENGKMNRYTKSLYHASLPGDCKSTVGVFSDFILRLANELQEQVQRMWGCRGSVTRDDWVALLAGCLESSVKYGGKKNSILFLSGIIIADVEEVVDGPFGEQEQLYLGSGGVRGLQLLASEPADGGGNIQKAERIRKYLNQDAPPHILSALGLERVDQVAVVKINRRPIQLSDVDNISCKMSHCQGKTTGARLIIQRPSLNSIYDFPLLPQWRCYFDHDVWRGPAEAGVSALPHISPEIHHQFKFKEEDTKWPDFCDRMDGYWRDLAAKTEPAGSTGHGKKSGLPRPSTKRVQTTGGRPKIPPKKGRGKTGAAVTQDLRYKNGKGRKLSTPSGRGSRGRPLRQKGITVKSD
jgi:hypothetical protein